MNSTGSELIQVSTSTGTILSTFIPLNNTLHDLIAKLLKEEGDDLIKTICGRNLDGGERNLERWSLQRARKSQPNRVWKEEELEALNQGKLN